LGHEIEAELSVIAAMLRQRLLAAQTLGNHDFCSMKLAFSATHYEESN
jgi:hypothetical protein